MGPPAAGIVFLLPCHSGGGGGVVVTRWWSWCCWPRCRRRHCRGVGGGGSDAPRCSYPRCCGGVVVLPSLPMVVVVPGYQVYRVLTFALLILAKDQS